MKETFFSDEIIKLTCQTKDENDDDDDVDEMNKKKSHNWIWIYAQEKTLC